MAARWRNLFKRLRAARLDNSTEAELPPARRESACSSSMTSRCSRWTSTATTDFNELTVARHRTNATVVTSQPDPR